VPGVPEVVLLHVCPPEQLPQELPQLSVLQLSVDEQGIDGVQEFTHVPGVPEVLLLHVFPPEQLPQELPQLSVPQLLLPQGVVLTH